MGSVVGSITSVRNVFSPLTLGIFLKLMKYYFTYKLLYSRFDVVKVLNKKFEDK